MRSPDGLDLLLVVIIVLLLLFPRPWFRPRARPAKPSCYADWPHYHPQDQAERDCQHCAWGMDCFDDTPYNPRVPPPRPAGSPPPPRPTR